MSLRVPVDQTDHSQGPADAPVTLVEYGDYQCPYCGAAYPLVKQLQERFGDDLRFVFRNFPLQELHENAMSAAMTAEFAATKGHFWEAHDALYENQEQLGQELYAAIVTQLGIDAAELGAALDSETIFDKVKKDFNGGVRSGVNGTPSFFVNGTRYDGPRDFETMAEALDRAIAAAKGSGPTKHAR
jgi:protein-disulfide isomerase